MADAQILFDEDVSATTDAIAAAFTDVALIPAGSFTAGAEYIVLAVFAAKHSSAANNCQVQLVRGATPTVITPDGTLSFEQLGSATQSHQVQMLRRFTQPGTAEDLKLQFTPDAATTVTHDYSAILAFKASDLGTENTHWFWSEDTADYTMTGTPTAKASETFTPNGTDRWLIIAEMTWDVVGVTTPIGFELHDGTSVIKSMQQEGEDATNDILSQMLVWVGVPTNSSKTYSVRPFNSGSSIALSNRIFALNLSQFDQSASDFTAAEVALAASPTFTNVATVAITPNATGDFVIIGDVIADVGSTTDDFKYRMQVNDGGGLASDPAYGDDSPKIDNWDITDETVWTFLKKRSLTTGGSRTVNIDGSMTAGTTMRAEDRALVVFSVKLAGGGAVSVTPTTAALTLATFAPTVTASDHKSVTPSTASLALTAFAPTVTASDHKSVTPTTAALTLATFAPNVTVAAGGSVSVTPTTASLALTAFAPTVVLSDHKSVTPITRAMTLATFAPTVTATAHVTVTPTTASLMLAAFAPTVAVSGAEGPSRLQFTMGTSQGEPVSEGDRMADALCTIAQVKARLFPAGTTDTSDDTMLTELVEEVSDYMQHFTGRKFVPEVAATYTFDTRAGYVLHVPRGIRSVTTMGLNTMAHQPDSGGSYTTLTAASILLRPLANELPVGWPPTEVRLSRATTIYFQTVENGATITGNFGFAATPPDIQAVAIDGTVSAYQMRKNGASGVFGADSDTGVPWWQFTAASMRTLKMYRYSGIA